MTKCKVCKYQIDKTCSVRNWTFTTNDQMSTYKHNYKVIGCKDGGKSLIIRVNYDG